MAFINWPLRLGRLWFFVAACGGMPAVAAEPESIEKMMAQWTQIERQSEHLQSQWRKRQPLITLQLALLNEERQTLEALLERAEGEVGNAAAEREELLEQQNQLEADQKRVGASLDRLQRQLQTYQYRLPPPLAEAWAQQGSCVSDDNSQVLDCVLGKLTLLKEFNQRIAVNRATIDVNGQSVAVREFYLGVARGWYVSGDGRHYGAGYSTPDGWHWRDESHLQTAAPEVEPAQLLAVLAQLEKTAEYEMVPLVVSLNPTGGSANDP